MKTANTSVIPKNTGIPVGFSWDPFAYKNTTDAESRLEFRDHRDPEQGPQPERGDRYLIIGATAGVVIGSVAGFVVGDNVLGAGGAFLGLVAGVIVGGLVGITIGGYFKKRIRMSNGRRGNVQD